MADTLWKTVVDAMEFARHSQILIGATVGAGMSAATWYITRRNYKQGTFRTRIEFVGVEPEAQGDGTYLVDFSTWGDQRPLSEIVAQSNLEKAIVVATKQTKDGFLRLPNALDHRRMMGIFEDHLSGRDPRANQEALEGMPTRTTDIIFAATYFFEEDEEMSMVRVFVISTAMANIMELNAREGRTSTFKARHPRNADFLKWATETAQRMSDDDQRSGDTAVIWPATIKTSFGGNTQAREIVRSAAA